ncbi:MAG: hypothetical protein KAU28_09770, partial [Phycisphaerae bacterium]|nr:hypothetical protein [Phycisphaerae bacterium]
AARRPAARGRQPKAVDPASYNRMQTAIPPLLATGALVLILATVLAVKLPSGKVDDPTHMTMPPHPMLANPATKWIVLSLFPVGAGLLFGAFMLALQVAKLPPSQDQAGPRPRRYDRARPTRRR